MSQAQDDTLMTLARTRMSVASIAGIMGWSEKRTAQRIEALRALAADAAEAPEPAAVEELPAPSAVEDSPPVPAPDPPRPEPLAARPLRRPPISRRSNGKVELLRPWTPERVRYAHWFLAARWPLQEVADLFDGHADDLAATWWAR